MRKKPWPSDPASKEGMRARALRLMGCLVDRSNVGSMMEDDGEEMDCRVPLPRLPVSIIEGCLPSRLPSIDDESRANPPFPEFQYVPSHGLGRDSLPDSEGADPAHQFLCVTPDSMNTSTRPHADLHATEFEHERFTRYRTLAANYGVYISRRTGIAIHGRPSGFPDK